VTSHKHLVATYMDGFRASAPTKADADADEHDH
jgi:hypothetical protein